MGGAFQNAYRITSPTSGTELAHDQPFALGLRLANDASVELSEPARLHEFQAWLAEHNLYVFTMNGFPYGGFHNTRVKDQVHAPDWTTTERTEYTKRLFSMLAQLVPEGMDGGVSTSPLSYRFWWNTEAEMENAIEIATRNIMEVADQLIEIKRETGKLLHLDIEPEPDGILENSVEFVNWYRDHLAAPGGTLSATEIRFLGSSSQRGHPEPHPPLL